MDEVREHRSITDHPFRRPVSARRLLKVAWSGEALTATEFMEKTGFTRATVLSACRELVEAGWFKKEADARAAGEYTKGRPALRHTFRPDAAFVVAGDADEDMFTVAVADLHGVERSRVALKVSSLRQAAQRRRTLKQLVEEALEAANVPAERVAAVTLGVPAPVDTRGSSPPPDGREHYWPTVNPDFASLFQDKGWAVRLDNDANLGALCESTDGAGVGVRSFATLLSAERFGAGIVVDGRLLRGARGGVGEMRILDMVMGVEAPHGLERRARWEMRQLDEKNQLVGELASIPPEKRDALAVFRAAERHDTTALEVVDALAERLARVVRLLSELLDLDRIIIAGAIAPSVGPLLQRTREILQREPTQRCAELFASQHGADIVLRGAITSAIIDVRKRALLEEE
ncbi:ROK family protein [Nesterenkonia salmonea]|uniref:ROK family protein n=1 Tax=Nesterenkonia salmonea TaxID=1804987 RepID=UPI00140A57E5|nr:ROK family protein [Nesterenkonia salmonea]